MNLVKGRHPVIELLQSDTPVDRVLIVFELKGKPEITYIVDLAQDKKSKIQWVSKSAFDRLGVDHAQGVVAYSASAAITDLSTILAYPNDYPMVVMMDHIEDPHNMGAILRTCEALGITTVVYPKDRQCQLNPTVSKVSAGAVHHMHMVRVTNLSQALDKMREVGYWVYAADSDAAYEIATFKPNRPWVLVMGNEHKGVSPGLSKKIHEWIRIELVGHVDSLNVSVATGILLDRLRR